MAEENKTDSKKPTQNNKQSTVTQKGDSSNGKGNTFTNSSNGKGNTSKGKNTVQTTNDSTNGSANDEVHANGYVTSVEKVKIDDSDNKMFGAILIIVMLALVMWAVVALANGKGIVSGTMTVEGESRVGNEVVISYDVGNYNEISADSVVEWQVNGNVVSSEKYDGSDTLQLNYTPTESGNHVVRVKINDKYSNATTINVGNPLLVVNVDSYTMSYNGTVPELTYQVTGLLDGDTMPKFDIALTVEEGSPSEKLSVGSYFIKASGVETIGQYDVQYKVGVLTVQPIALKLAGTLTKQYDGSDSFVVDSNCVSGALVGDIVFVNMQKVQLDSKDVGERKIVEEKLILSGQDSDKYILPTANLVVVVTPKKLTMGKVQVQNKCYDGTDKAQLDCNGKLMGIVGCDQVALSQYSCCYENSEVGEGKRVVVSNVKLVGIDKNNYMVDDFELVGSITSSNTNTNYNFLAR